jgi:hypothetical protein
MLFFWVVTVWIRRYLPDCSEQKDAEWIQFPFCRLWNHGIQKKKQHGSCVKDTRIQITLNNYNMSQKENFGNFCCAIETNELENTVI